MAKSKREGSQHVSPLKLSEEILNFEKWVKARRNPLESDNPFKIIKDRSNSAEILMNSIQNPKLSIGNGRNYNSRIMKAHSADLVL